MDPAIVDLITRIHAQPVQMVLCVTGGGVGLPAWLLTVPGGSRTVLEVLIPYSQQSLAEFLGHTPSSACSLATAEAMARRALARARWLAQGQPVAGLACTASLRSDRPKQGEHRFHAAIARNGQLQSVSMTLTKEARSREEEEDLVDRILLQLLARGLGIESSVNVPLLPGEHLEMHEGTPGLLARFFRGEEPAVCLEADGRVRVGGPLPRVVLCGSFNPLHEGHCQLAQVASELVGAPPAFELTVVNADKPPLPEEEVRRRAQQFNRRAPLWLTRAPTFAEKAQLFPGAVFVVGFDTAERILQPRFYGDSVERRDEALRTIRAQGCRFLVAGRVDAQGRFLHLEEMNLPPEAQGLFSAIPEERFRFDISSTQLRQGRAP